MQGLQYLAIQDLQLQSKSKGNIYAGKHEKP